MDEFEALVAPKTRTKAPPVDEFESLLAAKPAKPKADPGRAEFEKSLEPEGLLSGVVAPAAKKLVGAGADLVDLVFTGLLAPPVAAAGQYASTAKAELDNAFGYGEKKSRRQIAQAGLDTASRINQQMGTPVRSLLTSLGYLSSEDAPVEHAMGKVMSLVERDAAAVEERSGGKVLKEDVLGAVNMLFGVLGAKGTQFAGKKVADAKVAKEALKHLDEMKAKQAATDLQAEEAVAAEATRKRTEAEILKETEMRSAVRAAFVEDPKYARRPPPDNRFPPSGERTGSTDAVDLSRLSGRTAPVVRPGEEIGSSADQLATVEALRRRGLAADVPTAERGTVAPVAPDSLGSAIAKVNTGRAWDMTAEERIALRGTQSKMDPKIVTAAVIGATGLGLAMTLAPDAEEAALAVGAGALMLGRGRELKLETLTKMGEATPLGVILDQSPTTLSTLEKLPRNRFEFSVQSINELLKRQEVTKAERDVFAKALEGKDAGGTITAKELMVGVKKATGDFELTKKASDEFADYGLNSIGRDMARSSVEPYDGPMTTFDGKQVFEVPASTHIYRVPESITLGANNHFGDPQYFGHTRVFEEGGVRHVVELQSDLAQKAGKALEPEVQARLEKQLADLENQYSVITKRARAYDEKGVTVPLDIQRMENRLEVELAEVRGKLQGARIESIEPMLKNWHKRLIREELADAARGKVNPEYAAARERLKNGMRFAKDFEDAPAVHEQLMEDIHKEAAQLQAIPERLPPESVVRFADADTVAKVEGWPRLNAEGVNVELARQLGVADPVARTGETRLSPEHQGIYDRYAGDVTKFLKQLGGKHVVDSAGHGWWEVPVEGSKTAPAGKRVQQFGGASQDLLKAAAIIGGSVVLVNSLFDPENKTKAAIWTAAVLGLGMWAKSRVTGLQDMAKSAGHRAEDVLGNFSSEVRDISPPLLRRTRLHAWQELKLTYDAMQVIGPFVEKSQKIPSALREPINLATLTGKSGPVIEAFGKAGRPELITEWRKVRDFLGQMGQGLIETGRLKALLEDYYPRVITDYPGLMQAMGKEAKTYFDKLIEAETKKAIRDTGEGLSPLDLSILINKHLERGHGFGDGRPGFLKKRTIQEITAEYAPFYAPFTESLPLYTRAVIKEIQRAKFFGKDLVRGAETGIVDIDASVGNIVLGELQKGKITPDQFNRLEELLRSRFGPGERASDRLTQTYKNAANTMLLGDVFAAASNLSDVGPTWALHKLVPTMMAAAQMFTKNPLRITSKDMGMVKHIAEEFVHGTRSPVMFKVPFKKEPIQLSTSKFVDKTFKLAGWPLLDVGPKELMANAALNNFRRMVKSEKGVERLRQQYGEYFGEDFGPLLSDLRSGAKTELTLELGIAELADAQPIFKTEMPNFYNKYPNARFLYMLHTYPIKQLNLIRDRGFKEIARGNKAAGLSFLARYAVLATASGVAVTTAVNWLRGRDTDLSAAAIPFYALRNFGFSQYVVDKFKEGRSAEAIGAMVLPPIKPFVDALTGQESAVANIPLVGKVINDRVLGASEKANERLAKRQEQAQRKREGLVEKKEKD